MNETQIRYFLDVAETQHMTKSAQRLGVAQPALSRSIHRLEDELGAPLFERTGRNIRLTEAGTLARKRLSSAAGEIDALKAEVAALSRARTHTVRVKVRAASYLVVDAIAAWMAKHPESSVCLVQADGAPSPCDVEVYCPALGRTPAPSLEARVFTERIMVAVPERAGISASTVKLSDLASESFVSLAGSRSFTRVCNQLCEQAGFHPAVSLESDNPAAVRKMIALGLGVGFWPEWSWGDVKGDGVSLKRLDDAGFARSLVIARRTKAGAAFADHLGAFFAEEERKGHARA